ncbi:hypothetical protein ACYSNM_12655 [Myroides sp. LJL116]
MKKINLLFSLSCICLGFITSCDNLHTPIIESNPLLQNVDGTITIQGRVLVKNTNTPPEGVNTINIANKWKFFKKNLNAKGENEKVFVDKDGYYNITINKGDTIQFLPYHHFYKQKKPSYNLHSFENNQIVNFLVEPIDSSIGEQIVSKSYKNKEIFNVNPNKLVTLAGTVISKETGKPLENIMIMSPFYYTTLGYTTHHLTNKEGQFIITIPQNSIIAISSNTDSTITNYIEKDTIITYHL